MAYQNISVERKNKVFAWLETPFTGRAQIKEFRKSLKLSAVAFREIKSEWELERQKKATEFLTQQRKVRVKRNAIGRGEGKDYHQGVVAEREDAYDSNDWLLNRTAEADKALLDSLSKGSPASLKLFYQLMDRLIEKQEIIHGLTADETTRRNLEADRQLREDGYRVEEMPEKPVGLSE
ncbi:hypothetical protein LCGC14_1894640 [marine sediment metagenome]|uniref:Terminase small subunit n=1 Tax=marine sediment metagenome TaxID=412755 RepID=A0A0F9FYP4_9ZZZZ